MDTERASRDPLVAAVLAAACAPAEAPMAGEAAARAAFLRAYTTRKGGFWPRMSLGARATAAAAFGTLVMAGGVATAATGNLPAVTSVLGGGHGHSQHATGPQTSTGDEAALASYSGQVPNDAPGKGATISDLATSTASTGVDKGAEICTAASDGKCQAGTHGQDGSNTAAAHKRGPHAGADASSTGRATATVHRTAHQEPVVLPSHGLLRP